MEREKELAKLVNVLRRTARMALQSEWTGSSQDAARFCIDQYNRVLARLKELDPGVGNVFGPLPADSSLTVAAMACRQLAAYYEDEVGKAGWGEWGGVWGDPLMVCGSIKKRSKTFGTNPPARLKTLVSSFARTSRTGSSSIRPKTSRKKRAAPTPRSSTRKRPILNNPAPRQALGCGRAASTALQKPENLTLRAVIFTVEPAPGSPESSVLELFARRISRHSGCTPPSGAEIRVMIYSFSGSLMRLLW